MTEYKQLNYTADEIDGAVGALNAAMDDMEQNTANALIGEASGEVISLQDVEDIEHEMGVKVRGKNLIIFPFQNWGKTYNVGDVIQTTNGITFKVAPNGGIEVSGTATAMASAAIFGSGLTNKADIITAGTYYLSGGNENVSVIARRNGASWLTSNKLDNYAVGTFLATDTFDYVGVAVAAGKSFSEPVIIYPMLTRDVPSADFAPYVEDISAVKVKKYGKNLFNIANIVNRVNNENGREIGVKKIENDTALQISTPSTSAGSLDQRSSTLKDLAPEIRAGKTYTLSANTTGRDAKIYLMLSKAIWAFGTSRTLTDDDLNSTVVWYASGSGTTAVVSNIQIEDNTGDKVYEPYIEPVEYPVNVDGTVEGVTSLSPNMTLMTDTAGAVIDCKYHRDINTAFNELTQALIAINAL